MGHTGHWKKDELFFWPECIPDAQSMLSATALDLDNTQWALSCNNVDFKYWCSDVTWSWARAASVFLTSTSVR
eukprot:365345-Chlamydomonas_euryale.AAC.5